MLLFGRAWRVQATIREANPAFDRQIKGFAMPDAILTAVETRTSSPVCIRRDDSLQSVSTRGPYPGGEGAGILSAAVDGIKLAEAMGPELLGVARRASSLQAAT